MRGKESADSVPCHRRRITPAYAGKSCRPHSNIIVLGDHPRLCGEKHNARINRTGHVGSPPPMRGKDCLKDRLTRSVGITPAYAGKRCWKMRTANSWTGSPPPMRGKAALSGYDCTAGGITPAYAGKSFVLRSYRPCWRDHPRLCGEKL